MPSRHRRTAATMLLVPLLLGACSSGGGSADGPLVPAGAPDDAWTSHEMGPVALRAPADWEVLDLEPGDSSSAAFGLRAPGDGAGTGVHTSVTDERRRDAAAAVANLRSVGDASVGARDVEEDTDLVWPGAQAAGWLGYEATVPVGGDEVDMRYEYLVLDLDDDVQAIVAVVAPADEFEASGVHGVLATVTVR